MNLSLARGIAHLGKLLYRTEYNGLDLIEPGKPALIALKHQSYIDAVIGAYAVYSIIKRKIAVPAKVSAFKNALFAHFLRNLGAFPIIQQTDPKYSPRNPINMHAARLMLEALLKEKKLLVYAPEGTRVPGAIGGNFYDNPLSIATDHGIPIYVVGISYGSRNLQGLLPECLQRFVPTATPFFKATVNCEYYTPTGKSLETITSEIREKMATLSGLEPRL